MRGLLLDDQSPNFNALIRFQDGDSPSGSTKRRKTSRQ